MLAALSRTNMATRAQIQATARTFAGTPFKDQHRKKGVNGGLDCVGLVLLVAEDLRISYRDTQEMRGADYLNYSVGLHSMVLDECKKRLVEKSLSQMKAGDVIVMRIDGMTSHAGIVTERKGQLYMIHAFNGGPKCVTEHIIDFKWMRRICGVFEYPGVED